MDENWSELNTDLVSELTIAAHAQSETLLQPAVLTAVTVGPVD